MVVNEQQRMQYLDLLGIDMFVPRWVLPAAKASVFAPLPEARVSGVQEPVSPVAAPSAASTLEASVAQPQRQTADELVSVGAILSELGVKAPSANSEAKPRAEVIDGNKSTLVSELSQSQPLAVSFSLSIWRVSEQLMVLDSRLPKEALPTQALLQNILAAKQLRLASAKPEIINWPMFSGLDHSGGWDTASEMVCAFLRARLEQQAVKYLWLLGQDAYAAVMAGPENYSADLGRLQSHDEFATALVFLPSLADMLKTPELKRLTWHAIRDLD